MSPLRRFVARQVRRRFAELSRGDAGGVLAMYSDDVRFSYRGDHPLAIEACGRPQVQEWFQRLFAALGACRFVVDEVIVAGPPWRMTIVTLYTLHAGAEGHRLRSEGVQIARLAWGRITAETVLPDTQRVSSHLAACASSP